ncbi:MAG TPA: ABC transporter permease subunit [Clostridia bacterium]
MKAIAFATFREVLRKKLFYLVGFITLVYLILFSLITYYASSSIKEGINGSYIQIIGIVSQVVSFFGFYFASMLVAFLTVMSSLGAISTEIENGTIHAIITKPIKRWEYVAGKFTGLSVLMVGYSIFLYLSIFIICAAFGLPMLDRLGMPQLLKGLSLFILLPVSILSLSIMGSACFKTLSNGIMVISIYILGLIGGMMEQIGSILPNGQAVYYWGIFTSFLSPFDAIYRKMQAELFSVFGMSNIFFGHQISGNTEPSGYMTAYFFIYTGILLTIGIRNFSKRDIT